MIGVVRYLNGKEQLSTIETIVAGLVLGEQMQKDLGSRVWKTAATVERNLNIGDITGGETSTFSVARNAVMRLKAKKYMFRATGAEN